MDPGYESDSQDSQDSQDSSSQDSQNPWIMHLQTKQEKRYTSMGTLVNSIVQRTKMNGLPAMLPSGINRWLLKNEDRAGEYHGMQTDSLISHIQDYLTVQAQNDNDSQTTTLEEIAAEPPQAPMMMPETTESLAETVLLADGVAGYMHSSNDAGSNEESDGAFEDAQIEEVQGAIDAHLLQGLSSPDPLIEVPSQNISYVSQTPDAVSPGVGESPVIESPLFPVMPTGLDSPFIGISSSASTSKRSKSDKVLATLIDTLPNAPKMAQILGYNLTTGQGVAAFQRYLLQRAQIVQMRATPSSTARAKNNTARPRMFFNRFGSSREIRYT